MFLRCPKPSTGSFSGNATSTAIAGAAAVEKKVIVDPPEMVMTFLGTTSMCPTSTRNVSSVSLRVGGVTWLFDCGEGTQHQILRSDSVKASTITRIYISHLHGDHVWGLPSLMCKISSGNPSMNGPVVIIGPKGIRSFVRANLGLTQTMLGYSFIIHELHGNTISSAGYPNFVSLDLPPHPNELPNGQDIPASEHHTWTNLPYVSDHPLENGIGDCFTVNAAEISHRIFTVGYVVNERNYPGPVNPEIAKHFLEDPENAKFLLEKRGVKRPLSLISQLKSGTSIELKDRILHPHDITGPSRQGRKVVILGDTSDSRNLSALAAGADIMVHESTNAFLSKRIGTMEAGGKDLLTVTKKTMRNGHSTPEMAGSFAGACGVSSLFLTHFSPRYAAFTHNPQMLPPKPLPIRRESSSVMQIEDASKAYSAAADPAREVVNDISNLAHEQMVKHGKIWYETEKLHPLCTPAEDFLVVDISRQNRPIARSDEVEERLAKTALENATRIGNDIQASVSNILDNHDDDDDDDDGLGLDLDD